MISQMRKQSGFTIVELLIVIVVIGILAGLVVTTFSGVQKSARDKERQTDVKAIHGQLEAYYATNGRYPTLANLNDEDWVKENLKGLDLDALKDPKGANSTFVGAAAANAYAYAVTPTGCDNDDEECTGYTLTATLEGGGTYEKTALN